MTSRPLTALRRTLHIGFAFMRLDVVEDLSYPLAVLFRYVAPLFTVVLYLFQSRYLGAPETYSATLIGVSVSSALQMALTGFGARLQSAQDRGNLETFLVEPVPWRLVPFAMNLWRTTTGLIGMALMLVVGAALGADLRPAGIPMFLVVLVLGVVAANGVGILFASFLVVAKRAEPVLVLYGLAASLVGGSLFSIEILPPWLRVFSYVVPHTYVISAARQVLLDEPVAAGMPLAGALIGLALFSVAAFAIGLALFGRSLEYARRMGVLSGY